MFIRQLSQLIHTNKKKKRHQTPSQILITFKQMKKRLYLAIKNDDISTVQEFADNFPHYFKIPLDDQKHIALHLAIVKKNMPIIDIIAKKVNSELHKNRILDNQLALLHAVGQGNSATVSYMLKVKNVDVNYTDENGVNALCLATKIGDIEKVKLLLAAYGTQYFKQSGTCAHNLVKALLLANKLNESQIAYEIAKAYLPLYVYKTTKRPENHRQSCIPFSLFGMNYTAGEKLEASIWALARLATEPERIPYLHNPFNGQLENGELGLIWSSLKACAK